MPNSSQADSFTSKPIAICLSGGGYRAAGFHLGTMSYLHRVNLLENINSISTVSGGTFTGALYSVALLDGLSFDTFFKKTCDQLQTTHLIELALGRLKEKAGNLSGRRNLIISMAEIYGERFFQKQDHTPYLLKDILETETCLPDLAFNATEFRTGITFRFQNRKGARIGNGNVSVPVQDAENIRLADIVAASSCFPGGFEPLSFPDDFCWPHDNPPEKTIKKLTQNGLQPSLALMDGGIYDNQGAQTLDKAVYRDAEDLSLFMISDVSAREKEMYPFPQKPEIGKSMGKFTLGQVNIAVWALFTACGISAFSLGGKLIDLFIYHEFTFCYDFFLYVIPILLSGSTFAILYIIRKIIVTDIFPAIPQAKQAAWKDLKHLRLNQFFEMIYLRITSLFSLSSSIFMKRIRSLVYDRIYRDERYQKKRVANLIYDLQEETIPIADMSQPSDRLIKLSKKTEAMPTTLWFDNPGQLKDLLACGQATTCLNLIKIIIEKYGKHPEQYPENLKGLFKKLSKDWEAFCRNPHGLIE